MTDMDVLADTALLLKKRGLYKSGVPFNGAGDDPRISIGLALSLATGAKERVLGNPQVLRLGHAILDVVDPAKNMYGRSTESIQSFSVRTELQAAIDAIMAARAILKDKDQQQ